MHPNITLDDAMATQICPECKRVNYIIIGKKNYCGKCNTEMEETTIPETPFKKDELHKALARLQDEATHFPVRDDDSTLDDNDGRVATQELKMPDEDPADTSNMGIAIMQGGLILRDKLTGKRFHITADNLDEIILGRASTDPSYKPTVDLSVVDGHKHGVSRLHAKMRRVGSLLLISDYSINGTFLNGFKLVPNQERIVRDKDEIWLGRLHLQVLYVNALAIN
jgi:hypothetical protein